MGRSIFFVLLAVFMHLSFVSLSFGSDLKTDPANKYLSEKKRLNIEAQSQSRDIAFISVNGSRPDSRKLQGFQRAVLFNAKGEVVKKVDIRNDSIYSLDRLIEMNKNKGPMVIKMYR